MTTPENTPSSEAPKPAFKPAMPQAPKPAFGASVSAGIPRPMPSARPAPTPIRVGGTVPAAAANIRRPASISAQAKKASGTSVLAFVIDALAAAVAIAFAVLIAME